MITKRVFDTASVRCQGLSLCKLPFGGPTWGPCHMTSCWNSCGAGCELREPVFLLNKPTNPNHFTTMSKFKTSGKTAKNDPEQIMTTHCIITIFWILLWLLPVNFWQFAKSWLGDSRKTKYSNPGYQSCFLLPSVETGGQKNHPSQTCHAHVF